MHTSDVAAGQLLRCLPPGAPVAAFHDGDDTVVGISTAAPVLLRDHELLRFLDLCDHGTWAGFATYEAGRAIERGRRGPSDRARAAPGPLPAGVFVRLDARARLRDGVVVEVTGDPAPSGVLERAAEIAASGVLERAADRGPEHSAAPEPSARGQRWSSDLSADAFQAGVRTVLRAIRAGECYQVNLTRRLALEHALAPEALYLALVHRQPAPYAAIVRVPVGDARWSVVSASPECFLRKDGDLVVTRPIKGTARDAATLATSEKERAENTMIVDMARNDLGRVCVPGTIEVPALWQIEQHPGLHHLVSTVAGRLRPGTGLGALFAATFPPASVTGAPKPRVLEVIESLERSPRGVYCGAIGWFDADRDRADFSVAIRTFEVVEPASGPGCTRLGVGAGIVADSDPIAEWEETNLKAERLLQAAATVDVAPVAHLVPEAR